MVKKKFIAILIAMATLCFFCSVVVFAKADTVENKTLVAGEDFVISQQQGSLKVEGLTLFTGSYTNGIAGKGGLVKSFAYVLRGECIVVKFSQSINVKEYESIKLKLMKNIESDAEFRFYKNTIGETGAKESTVMNTGVASREVELSLEKYADENGLVDSIIIEHYSDKLEVEEKNFQILIYESELIVSVPAADYKLKVNGTDMVNGSSEIVGTKKKDFVISVATAKLYCNEFVSNSIAVLEFGKAIDTADYKTLNLNVTLGGLSSVYKFYLELYKTSETDIRTAIPVARISFDSGKKVNLEIDLTSFADDDGIVDGIVFYHYANTRNEDAKEMSFWIHESNVLTRMAVPDSVYWSASVTGAEYSNNFDGTGNNMFILSFNKPLFKMTAIDVTNSSDIRNLAKNVLVNGKYFSEDNSLIKYIAGYNGNAYKLALVFNKKITGDGSDNFSFIKGSPVKVEHYVYYLDSDYDFVPVYQSDDLLTTVYEYGKIDGVTAEYGETETKINISFTRKIGNLDDIYEKIILNDIKISEAVGVSVSVHSTLNNILVLTVATSSKILKNDGTDNVVVENGAISDRLYVPAQKKYYQNDVEDKEWFADNGKTFEIVEFESFYASNDYLIKFSLKISETVQKCDFSTSSALKKITVNGVSLYEISKRGEVSAKSENGILKFIIEKAVTGLHNDGTDFIIIEENFALPVRGKTAKTKYFKFNEESGIFEETEKDVLFPDTNGNTDNDNDFDNDNNSDGGQNRGCSGKIESAEIIASLLLTTVASAFILIKKTKKS